MFSYHVSNLTPRLIQVLWIHVAGGLVASVLLANTDNSGVQFQAWNPNLALFLAVTSSLSSKQSTGDGSLEVCLQVPISLMEMLPSVQTSGLCLPSCPAKEVVMRPGLKLLLVPVPVLLGHGGLKPRLHTACL
jgi:hypothetical protein